MGLPFRALIAAFGFVAMSASHASAGGFQFDELWKHAKDEFSSRFYKATGSLKICAANEVKGWLEKEVVPAFKETEKAVTIRESDLEFNGSGVLVETWIRTITTAATSSFWEAT